MPRNSIRVCSHVARSEVNDEWMIVIWWMILWARNDTNLMYEFVQLDLPDFIYRWTRATRVRYLSSSSSAERTRINKFPGVCLHWRLSKECRCRVLLSVNTEWCHARRCTFPTCIRIRYQRPHMCTVTSKEEPTSGWYHWTLDERCQRPRYLIHGNPRLTPIKRGTDMYLPLATVQYTATKCLISEELYTKITKNATFNRGRSTRISLNITQVRVRYMREDWLTTYVANPEKFRMYHT